MEIFRFWLENTDFFPNNDHGLDHMHQFLKSILIVRSVNTKKLCCCLLSYTSQQDIGYLLDYKGNYLYSRVFRSSWYCDFSKDVAFTHNKLWFLPTSNSFSVTSNRLWPSVIINCDDDCHPQMATNCLQFGHTMSYLATWFYGVYANSVTMILSVYFHQIYFPTGGYHTLLF